MRVTHRGQHARLSQRCSLNNFARAYGWAACLGYDVKNQRLVVNEKEAKTVRHIFRRFVELGSSTMLVKELRLDGATSKAWTTQDGRVRDGKPIDKSLIYKLLNNRTYLGELRHKEQWYPGEHEPIIDKKQWEDVQAILATNGRQRGNATRARVPFLLKGIALGADGRALRGCEKIVCRGIANRS